MIRLLGDLWILSNEKLTHPWDATSYFVAGKEPALIDCGSSLGYLALKRDLAEAGYRPRDIRTVIATHGHWDHLSGMALLREESDARLYIHAADRAQIEAGDADLTAAFLYDQPFQGVAVDGTLEDGEDLVVNDMRFTVHHTPGHSPGSVCLWTAHRELKLLVAGDTLWGGYHPKIRSDLDDWHNSLDHLLALEFDAVTIGHCHPTLIYDAKRKVREAKMQLGVFFNPWFKPFALNDTFRY